MTTLYDVPAEALDEAVAAELADRLDRPDWEQFAKSGADAELPPEQEDFWERRAASLLRTVATDGPVGVERLATAYGGNTRGSNRYRVAPNRRVDGSRNVIRTILQDLQEEGLVEEAGSAGRRITAEGRSLLDDAAADVMEELDRDDLERYA